MAKSGLLLTTGAALAAVSCLYILARWSELKREFILPPSDPAVVSLPVGDIVAAALVLGIGFVLLFSGAVRLLRGTK